jgi:hypothetical protein
VRVFKDVNGLIVLALADDVLVESLEDGFVEDSDGDSVELAVVSANPTDVSMSVEEAERTALSDVLDVSTPNVIVPAEADRDELSPTEATSSAVSRAD